MSVSTATRACSGLRAPAADDVRTSSISWSWCRWECSSQPGCARRCSPKISGKRCRKREARKTEGQAERPATRYTLCHAAGCTAEMVRHAELLTDLKSNGGIMVFSLRLQGHPSRSPYPLAGFEQALGGASLRYAEIRRSAQSAHDADCARQQQLQTEMKNRTTDLQKFRVVSRRLRLHRRRLPEVVCEKLAQSSGRP